MRMKYKRNNYFFTWQVDIPKREYKGQKLKKLVTVNIPDKSNNTIPKVPLITFVKNKVTKIAEISNLIPLSTNDMFFFMILLFY